jgi:hypothetical protein
MNAMSRTLGACAALALTLFAGFVVADDVKIPQTAGELMKAMNEAGKPGPEHAKLQPLVGSWTYTCKFWTDPSKSPFVSTGTIERQWILGGRFLEERVSGTNFDGSPGFEGLGLIGYDNGQKKYTTNWFSNMGTGACGGVGDVDAAGTLFTFHNESYCPVRKKVVQSREELRIEPNGSLVMASYENRDGKETKIMELVCDHKK